MDRFIKAQPGKGYQDILSEKGDLLEYLAFGKLSLASGKSYSSATGDYETVLVILTGKAEISAGNETWKGLGGRKSVFDGKATSVYVPIHADYRVVAETDVEIAVCKIKAEEKHAPFVVLPDEVVVNQRGKEAWHREVHDIVADQADGRVHRVVLGETFNDAGQWSSFPPHKHDGEFAPIEPEMEEVYHYQVDPEQGFGVQLHYTADRSIDDAHILRQGDSFAIDKGYHPVVAAGGYRVYYLWFMAGPSGRKLMPYDDPDHAWVK